MPSAHISLIKHFIVAALTFFAAQAANTADFSLSKLDNNDHALIDLSIEELMNIKVTTVTRRAQKLSEVASAVFVITRDDIKRSGVTSIPEALRMAPGVEVARIGTDKWSVSIRGFNGRFANKLQVLMDGRSVYNPLFAGVQWEQQDTLMEDIERIEVIRGPGSALWGANAVNGIINIITKKASQTHGSYAIAGGGSVEQGFAGARLGNRTASGVDWRVSGQWFERDNFRDPTGDRFNETQFGQFGFRTDWQQNATDSVTVQGDHYNGISQGKGDRTGIGIINDEQPLSGSNLLARWTRQDSETESTSLQVYFDRTNRLGAGFNQDIRTFDVDFFNRFDLNAENKFIWGFGYRRIWDELTTDSAMPLVAVDPTSETIERISLFAQNQYELVDETAFFTIGTKLSYNTYSKAEVQPSVRLLWLPSDDSAAWASVSRAVRTPSRADQTAIVQTELTLPAPPFAVGTPIYLRGDRFDFSEVMIAYELGYRRQPTSFFSWDVAMYYNAYESLVYRELKPGPGGIPAIFPFQGGSADNIGFEITSTLQVNDDWRLTAWYSLFTSNIDLSSRAVETSTSDESVPRNQAYLMSSWDLSRDWEFDLISRYNDNVVGVSVPSYIALDARIAYRPTRNMELTVVGQSLLESSRQEYGSNIFTGDTIAEVPRGVYGSLQLRY